MSMEKSRELAVRYLINTLMEDNDKWLETMENPENESYVLEKKYQDWIRKIECLLVQIQQDSERGDQRSMFRKLLVLRGLLRTKLE